jgi:mRNA interferase MazF
MRKPIVPFEAGEIVCVPFPFTDRAVRKRRPALVLSVKSFNDRHLHLILAMVTSAKNPPWPSDIAITDETTAGLPSPSVIRLKLFTLDERLVLDTLGKLSKSDKAVAMKRIASTLGIAAHR